MSGATDTTTTYAARNQVGTRDARLAMRSVSPSAPSAWATGATTAQKTISGSTGIVSRRSLARSQPPYAVPRVRADRQESALA